ncbi:hypothetical protein ACFL23_00875 [Patescibacteria group bacterium]
MKLKELMNKEKFILFNQYNDAIWQGKKINVHTLGSAIFKKIEMSSDYNVLLTNGQKSHLVVFEGGKKIKQKIKKFYFPLDTKVIKMM